MSDKCERCGGSGTMLDGIEDNGDLCPECGGSGIIEMWKPIIGYEGRYSISDMG